MFSCHRPVSYMNIIYTYKTQLQRYGMMSPNVSDSKLNIFCDCKNSKKRYFFSFFVDCVQVAANASV